MREGIMEGIIKSGQDGITISVDEELRKEFSRHLLYGAIFILENRFKLSCSIPYLLDDVDVKLYTDAMIAAAKKVVGDSIFYYVIGGLYNGETEDWARKQINKGNK